MQLALELDGTGTVGLQTKGCGEMGRIPKNIVRRTKSSRIQSKLRLSERKGAIVNGATVSGVEPTQRSKWEYKQSTFQTLFLLGVSETASAIDLFPSKCVLMGRNTGAIYIE